MKTLREVADELCPYRLEDYDPAIDDMSDELIRMGWINGFITGAQWREDNPVAADSASDPQSDSIELRREAPADPGGMGGIMRSRLDLGR